MYDYTGQIVHNGKMLLYVIDQTEDYALIQNIQTKGLIVAFRMAPNSAETVYEVSWQNGHYFNLGSRLENLQQAVEFYLSKK